MTDLIGKRLGKWVVERELGRGGMGRVYLAHDEPPPGPDGAATVTYAALKVLAAELSQEPGFLERFQREIEVLRQLHHPHIVRLYDSGLQDGLYYFAMEYVPGRNFDDLLNEQGRLPWKDVLDVALQIGPALKHAHDHGVIHRDLKPQNLLCTDEGVVKLTDFGIAKVFASRQLTVTGGLVGTAEYLSPEQAAGKPVTSRSDLYSFGVVLYTLLTGRPPFQGKSTLDLMHKHRYGQFDPPQRIIPEVPSELNKIVCALLEKDPSRRPANGLVLLRQLEGLQRKLKRREQHTVVTNLSQSSNAPPVEEAPEEAVLRDRPGPATLMSRWVREEIESQRRVGPVARFLNRPLVLVTLFLLCVGVIVYGIWFRPHHATEDVAEAGPVGEAQRIYQQGLRLYLGGEREAARERWQRLVDAFQGVESARRWVDRAQGKLQGMKGEPTNEHRWDQVELALQRARKLRDEGRRKEAEAVWDALEDLYWNDPSARRVMQEILRDRGAG